MGANTSSRLPSTVQVTTNAAGNLTAIASLNPPPSVPIRRQQFTGEQLTTNPEDAARQLNQALEAVHTATLPARSYPRNQSTTFEGIVMPNGQNVSIQHNLGTKVRWSIVRMYGSTLGGGIVTEPTDSQKSDTVLLLYQGSGDTLTVDVEVWSAG